MRRPSARASERVAAGSEDGVDDAIAAPRVRRETGASPRRAAAADNADPSRRRCAWSACASWTTIGSCHCMPQNSAVCRIDAVNTSNGCPCGPSAAYARKSAPVVTTHCIRLPASASRSVAVGPAEREHLVDPDLQQRRHAVPVDRVLQHDQVDGLEAPLLGLDVDVEVGIQVVQRATVDEREVVDGRQQLAIGERAFGVGVREDQRDGRSWAWKGPVRGVRLRW